MNFVNDMAAANFYPTIERVEYKTTRKSSAGKTVMLIISAAAIALTTGIGAAKICTDCLSECFAYADPIEETVSVEDKASATGLLAETLKGTSVAS